MKLRLNGGKKSRKLAELVKRTIGESTVIDKCEFKTLDKPYDYIIHPILFDSFKQAKAISC